MQELREAANQIRVLREALLASVAYINSLGTEDYDLMADAYKAYSKAMRAVEALAHDKVVEF